VERCKIDAGQAQLLAGLNLENGTRLPATKLA
jgi:hypothetical protein